MILTSQNAGTVSSYKAFPYLPKSIADNNLLSPSHQFINLPTNNGNPYWTEDAPSGWLQYSPYYNVFLKFYLKADGSDENIANGGGNIHSLKSAGLGSSLGLSKAVSISTNTVLPPYSENKNWTLYQIFKTIPITTQTSVNFGCFYKVLAQDFLRGFNFGGIALYFTKGARSSYLNYSAVHGGAVSILGGLTNYTYFNTYDSSKVYEAYNQWLGQDIIKIKRLALRNLTVRGVPNPAIVNQWQFLNHVVQIPTFVSGGEENDGVSGVPDSCTMIIFFAENNSYLDDQSGINTGAIQFLYPFLTLS
jgi:hypothetical protein